MSVRNEKEDRQRWEEKDLDSQLIDVAKYQHRPTLFGAIPTLRAYTLDEAVTKLNTFSGAESNRVKAINPNNAKPQR